MLTSLWRAPGFPLFRVHGILVEAHWSLAIPTILYAGLLASSGYLGRYADLSNTAITAMTIASVLLLPASVLLHELGHAFRARREGLQAERITLWGLGGVAWIGAARSPGAAFRVTAAGPLVSALLAVVLAGLGWLGGRVGAPDPVVGVTVLLAQVNALMFAFNLMPVFPMDGGRILHSALWRLRGHAVASVWAIRVGTAVAVLVIALGAVGPLVGLSPAGAGINLGLSVMIQGAIMLWINQRFRPQAHAPASGPRDPVVGDLLEPSAARPGPTPETTIAQFLEDTPRSQGYGTSASAVLAAERTVGVISPGLAGQVPADRRRETTVADVMLRREDAVALKQGTPVEEAFQRLKDGSRRGVVLDGRRVTAIILIPDLADVLLRMKDVARGVADAPISSRPEPGR